MHPTPTIDADTEALISQWDEAAKRLEHAKAEELRLRLKLFQHLFPQGLGKHKTRLPYGMALLGEQKTNYKVDRAVMATMMQDPELAPILNGVLSHSPKVKEGEWKKLGNNVRALLADLITETAATPTLEIKPQDQVKW